MSVPTDILDNARRLRSTQTDAEQLMWMLLRGRRFCGFKFRRQHPLGRYILDFFCLDAMLAVELDGGGHNQAEQAEYDEERTKELESSGIRVIRFWNNDVLKHTDAVLEALYAALQNGPSPVALRHPLPAGEGKRLMQQKIYPSPTGRRCPKGG